MILIINMKWNASGVLSLDVLKSVSDREFNSLIQKV